MYFQRSVDMKFTQILIRTQTIQTYKYNKTKRCDFSDFSTV